MLAVCGIVLRTVGFKRSFFQNTMEAGTMIVKHIRREQRMNVEYRNVCGQAHRASLLLCLPGLLRTFVCMGFVLAVFGAVDLLPAQAPPITAASAEAKAVNTPGRAGGLIV
ncbi:MAG: hypothetical protein P4K83_01375 [Terracidiphilus sp.]|nr:hypothetical protein [Terracidiphilus sp.]